MMVSEEAGTSLRENCWKTVSDLTEEARGVSDKTQLAWQEFDLLVVWMKAPITGSLHQRLFGLFQPVPLLF